jgi:hypothetical protein
MPEKLEPNNFWKEENEEKLEPNNIWKEENIGFFIYYIAKVRKQSPEQVVKELVDEVFRDV